MKQSLSKTDKNCITHATPSLRVILSGAAQISKSSDKIKDCRGVEPRRGASRRNLGTRVRHHSKTPSAHQSSAIAALFRGSHLPNQQKTSPKSTRPQTKRIKSSLCKGGCSWGKFSVREGGLERESPLFQEGALSLQGLLLPPSECYIQ